MTNTQGEDVAGGFEYARIFLPNRCTDSPYWRSHFGASGGSKPGEFSSNFAGLYPVLSPTFSPTIVGPIPSDILMQLGMHHFTQLDV